MDKFSSSDVWCPMLQYLLYTVMVFDEWEQCTPMAFTIQGKSCVVDIVPWLRNLNARSQDVMSDW